MAADYIKPPISSMAVMIDSIPSDDVLASLAKIIKEMQQRGYMTERTLPPRSPHDCDSPCQNSQHH